MAELKKVAQIMRRFVPEKWGGTESVVFHVSRELIQQGVESPIFCTAMFSTPGRQAVKGVLLHRFSYCFPWFRLSPEAKERLRLKGGSPLSLALFFGLMKEKNISVIHTHVQHRLGGMARTAARLKGIPLVVSLHGGCFTLPQEQIDNMVEPFSGKLEWGKGFGFLFGARQVLNDADAILCVGADEYQQVRRHYPANKIFHVPNGVDVPRFSTADGTAFRDTYGYQASEKLVLCVSRIDEQKNQLNLIRCFARFVTDHPDHRLVLIGPVTVEAYYHQLLDEIKHLDLERTVRVIPGLEPDNPLLAGAYKAAQFFVLASRYEPFGIVILEAWAAGLPVLAHNLGGIAGFCTDHENALLVELDNESQLLGGMGALANQEALRTALSGKAFQAVSEEFDWPVVVRKIYSIYEDLVTKQG